VSVLRLEGVHREIGDFVILDDASGAVARGERVGLVGANGAGKTTLLEIVAGLQAPDGGRVVTASGVSVGLLSQETNLDAMVAAAPRVRDAVRSGAVEVERLERRLYELETGGASAVESPEYASLRERFETLDGYHLDQRVDEALSGLGIPREDWARPVLSLSGGEQTRTALARLLVADPDLLLLDEPTNHLDLGALEWLESALSRRKAALLVASHDRAFLDAVVTRTWELRDRMLTAFRGSYSAYLVQREERDARQRKDAEGGAEAAAREVELIQRYRSHRKFSKMHEHERRLEQLQQDRIAAPRAQSRMALRTSALLGGGPTRSGDMVVALEDVLAGFPAVPGHPEGIPILRVRRLEATRGDRIGIVGPNGAGKTTLVRTVAGELAQLDGFVRLGAAVQPAYLAQLRAAAIPGSTVLDALLAMAPVDTGPARSYLARFLFRGEDVFKPVSELSGGERSRLELALLGVSPANLLLLDEPTNHLDIPAREALESFLRDSPATLLIVSHDRRLLAGLCERLWVVEAGTGGEPGLAVEFDGGYQAWRAAVADGWTVPGELERTAHRHVRPLPAQGSGTGGNGRSRSATVAASAGDGNGMGRKAAPQTAVPRPAASSGRGGRPAPLSKDAYRRQQRVVEEDLTRLGLRKSQLELALGDAGIQANFVELRRLSSELADVDQALGQAEEAWLALAERAPR
jgi:ATP-binding cassette subfamily F protein 3